MKTERAMAVAMTAVVAGAWVVGVVTGRLGTYLVVSTPAMFALTFQSRRQRWASYAVLPVAMFWLVIASLVALSRTGLIPDVPIAESGAATVVTLLIGLAALVALAASARTKSTASIPARLGAFWVFAAFQLATFWLMPYVR
jgi:hypothetical protein